MTAVMKTAIARVVAGESLATAEVAEVFGLIMDGAATPAQIGGLLIALRMKGETAEELAGAASAMRARAVSLACPVPEHGVDTCGTGGDSSGSVNISTLAAIIEAAAGAVVVKHGNRALSSRSGSADVLEAMGVKIDASPAVVERCLREVGIGFAFAPAFHVATKHANGPRRELGTRTMFNLLGPLTNPGRVLHQVVGVFDEKWCRPMASALGQLGSARAFVVHGRKGSIDEIGVAGETMVAEWNGQDVVPHLMTPRHFGFEECDPAGLAGGSADDNATILHAVLGNDGVRVGGPRRAVFTAAVMEVALALYAIGRADDLRDGVARATAVVSDGSAARLLARWAVASHHAEDGAT